MCAVSEKFPFFFHAHCLRMLSFSVLFRYVCHCFTYSARPHSAQFFPPLVGLCRWKIKAVKLFDRCIWNERIIKTHEKKKFEKNNTNPCTSCLYVASFFNLTQLKKSNNSLVVLNNFWCNCFFADNGRTLSSDVHPLAGRCRTIGLIFC